jgi:GAF domain
MATKKTSNKKRATLRDPKMRTSVAEEAQINAQLRQQLAEGLEREKAALKKFQDRDQQLAECLSREKATAEELEDCKRQLIEALEQQTATSEILGVIASSPTDIQPVLDTIAENAARVCGSYDAVIRLVEGNILRRAAHYGTVEPGFGVERPLTRSSISGRAVLDRELIHIEDLMTVVVATEFPEAVTAGERMGGRTVLAAPLLREGVAIGVILIRRTEVQPFH